MNRDGVLPAPGTWTDAPPAKRPLRSLLGRLRRAPTAVLSLAFLIVALVLWQRAVAVFEVPRIILPGPWDIGRSLFFSLQTASYYRNAGVTLYEAGAGFALGGGTGFLLAVLISRMPLAERTLYPFIVAFQTLPKVSIAPLLLVWFGYGLTSKIVITATMSFFPLLANTLAGLRATPADQRELFRSLRASSRQTFLKLELHNALPYVFVGIDLSVLLSVTGAIVGEFVGSRSGLGFLILQRNTDLNMPGIFAILITLAAIGMALHWAVQLLRRHWLFWSQSGEDRVPNA
jgi:NitT/TauT family transport system permease protein